jgi:hypothetical protein
MLNIKPVKLDLINGAKPYHEYQKSSNRARARPARSVPFLTKFNDRPAYNMVANGQLSHTLYFSRETRKEEGGGLLAR